MSRNDILRALRRLVAPPVPAPPAAGPWSTYRDRPVEFANALAAAGGRCVGIAPGGSIVTALDDLCAATGARRIFCRLPDLDRVTIELPLEPRPYDYEDVDLAVLPGVFGVAENGAVWVTDVQVPQPSVLFLATHLVLVIDRQEVVDNMHEAYSRLSFTRHGFGTFIAGPSKTADIEQALVIGAHGPRSLTVLLRS